MKSSARIAAMAAIFVLSAGLLTAGSGATATEQAAAADVVKENVVRVGGVNDSSGGHVVFEGNRLYMGTYGTGFRIFDISNPTQPEVIGQFQPGTPRADAVPDAIKYGDREFVIFGGTSRVSGAIPPLTTIRTEFFDATDPSNPVKIHEYIGNPDGEAHNGDIFEDELLWLPSGLGGDNGLRIYDIEPLLDDPHDPTPANDPVRLWPPDSCRNDGNVFCDPTTLWANSPHREGRPVGPNFVHTHDISIYPDYPVRQANGTFQNRDIILLAEGGAYTSNNTNNGSMFVIDITDPTDPVVLYRWLHETGANHHPIRYHHEAQFVDGEPGVVLVTDEDLHNGCGGAGGVVAVQLDPTLTSGTELSEWYIPQGTPAPVCSAHVFSTVNSIMFMGSYNAGLQVVDYSNPSKPTQVGQYIAEGSNAWGAYFHEGYVYQGDMSRGLDVLQYLGPGVPKPAGALTKCPGSGKAKGRQIIGTAKKDVLKGEKGRDIICGLGDNDVIRGVGGKDLLIGGPGKDRMNGGRGQDRVRGGPGKDRIVGGGQNDRCTSGPGNDRATGCERGH
jgi:hypothetical protein